MCGCVHIISLDYRDCHHPVAKAKRAQEREAKKAEDLKQQSGVIKKPSEMVESPTAPRVEVKVGREEEQNGSGKDSRTPSQPVVQELILKQGYRCSYQAFSSRRKKFPLALSSQDK